MKYILKQGEDYIRIEADKLTIQCQRGHGYINLQNEQVYVLDEPIEEIIIKGKN